jgi:hypothetical protein
MAGAFTPDVAELVKPAIGIFLADMAIQEGFEPQMFVDEEPIEGEVTDEAFFRILKNKNPELFAGMVEELNKDQRAMIKSQQEFQAVREERKQERENVKQNSFLTVEEKPQ